MSRIVFFGTPNFAVPSLERLAASGFDVVAAVTAPDKPVGRKQVLTGSPVKSTATQLGIPVLQPTSLKGDAFYEQFVTLKPDACIIVSYGKIIPGRYLAVPRLGFVNVHPSLLPRWRGPSPIQATLRAGNDEAGVSIMRIDEEVDHGPVLAQERTPLTGTEHLPELSDSLATHGADLLARILSGYLSGDVAPVPQDHARASFCTKVTRDDARIDWAASARDAFNAIRAYSGEPNAWTTWDGKVLNVPRATGTGPDAGAPGTVVRQGTAVAVAAGDGSVVLEQVQLEGGTVLSAADFVNGRGAFVGSVLA